MQREKATNVYVSKQLAVVW